MAITDRVLKSLPNQSNNNVIKLGTQYKKDVYKKVDLTVNPTPETTLWPPEIGRIFW